MDLSRKNQQIHITFCPNNGQKHGFKVPNFRLGTHHGCPQKELALQNLIPVHGLGEIFEESRRCLELLAVYFSRRLPLGSTQLTFDFLSPAPRDTSQLLKCLRPMVPLRQLCVGAGGRFLEQGCCTVVHDRRVGGGPNVWHQTYLHPDRIGIPRGGQVLMRDLIKQESAKLIIEDPPQPTRFHS